MQRFYFSVASGTQRRVCEALEHPYVLINFMTKSNQPPRHQHVLFVDSGGFPSSYQHNGYKGKSDAQYLNYVMRHRAECYALRDYPCEPQILRRHNLTVQQQIQRTLQHHLRLLDLHDSLGVKAQPVPVLQGWHVSEYLDCLDSFREHGLIKDYMAIGSLCRRHATKQIARIILTLHSELPRRVKLHAFGTKISVLSNPAVFDSLFSVDSGAFDYAARWKKLRKSGMSTYAAALEYAMDYLSRVRELQERRTRDSSKQTFISHYVRS